MLNNILRVQIELLGDFEELDSVNMQFGAQDRDDNTLFAVHFVNGSTIAATNGCFVQCMEVGSQCKGVQLVLHPSNTVWCYGLSIANGTSEEECSPVSSCKSYTKRTEESTTTNAASTQDPWRTTECRPVAQMCR